MANNKRAKTILVTGGAGFIGSNFLNTMVVRYPDYDFVNVDSLTYAADPKNITVAELPNYYFSETDIRDLPALEAVFKKFSPTDVIHFAAESHVDNSIAGPGVFVETNILGTHNLLDLARRYGIRRFHQISTDEVYGSLVSADEPVDEKAPLQPNSPYSASKTAADLLVRSYHKTYGLDTVITRATNNYGPNQHLEKLIPRFITNLLEGKKLPVYGSGKNVRDWIYVGDHVEGIDLVFHKGRSGHIYNIGGGTELENLEIVERLLALAGAGSEMIAHVDDRPAHDFRYALNSGKITGELGWKPRVPIDVGLSETFAFYKTKFDPR